MAWIQCAVCVTLMVMTLQDVQVQGQTTFSVSNCAVNPGTELLTFPDFAVSPHPVALPGDFSVTASLQVNRRANGSITLDVHVERFFHYFWITIPCIGGVGTCQYRDTCRLLRNAYGEGCPSQFVDHNVPCTCPMEAGTYSMTDAIFSVSHLSGVWAWLIEGDYRATARLIDNLTGEEIACQQLHVSIVSGSPPCDTFWCRLLSG